MEGNISKILDNYKSEFKKEKTFKRRKDELERTLETLKDTSEEHYLPMDDIIKENDLIMETIIEINEIIFGLKVGDENIEGFFEGLLESLTTIKDMGVSTNESKIMRKYSSIDKIKKMIIGDKENYRKTQLTLFADAVRDEGDESCHNQGDEPSPEEPRPEEVKGVGESSNLSRLKKLRRINKVYKTDDLIQLKKLKEIFKYLETNTTITGDRLELLLDPDEYKDEEFVDKDYDDMTIICALNKLLLPGNSTDPNPYPEPLSGYGLGSVSFHAINKNTETTEMLCMLTTKTIQHKEFLSVLLDELIMMMDMKLDLENLKRPICELMKEERSINDLDKILLFASKLSFFEPFLNKIYSLYDDQLGGALQVKTLLKSNFSEPNYFENIGQEMVEYVLEIGNETMEISELMGIVHAKQSEFTLQEIPEIKQSIFSYCGIIKTISFDIKKTLTEQLYVVQQIFNRNLLLNSERDNSPNDRVRMNDSGNVILRERRRRSRATDYAYQVNSQIKSLRDTERQQFFEDDNVHLLKLKELDLLVTSFGINYQPNDSELEDELHRSFIYKHLRPYIRDTVNLTKLNISEKYKSTNKTPYIYKKALKELAKEENIPVTKLKNILEKGKGISKGKGIDTLNADELKELHKKMLLKMKALTESGKYKIPKSNLERYTSLKSQIPEIADNLMGPRVRPLEGIDECALEFSSSSGSTSEDLEYGIPKELNERFNPNEIAALLDSVHKFLHDPDISEPSEMRDPLPIMMGLGLNPSEDRTLIIDLYDYFNIKEHIRFNSLQDTEPSPELGQRSNTKKKRTKNKIRRISRKIIKKAKQKKQKKQKQKQKKQKRSKKLMKKINKLTRKKNSLTNIQNRLIRERNKNNKGGKSLSK